MRGVYRGGKSALRGALLAKVAVVTAPRGIGILRERAKEGVERFAGRRSKCLATVMG